MNLSLILSEQLFDIKRKNIFHEKLESGNLKQNIFLLEIEKLESGNLLEIPNIYHI